MVTKKEYNRLWYQRNRERVRENRRRYRRRHPDRVKETNREYHQSEKGKVAARRSWEKLLNDPVRLQRKKDYIKRWKRLHSLFINGKYVTVSKWERPGDSCCELCSRSVKILHYHHWDDEHPEFGVWVCGKCHIICEGWDKGVITRYLSIRDIRGEGNGQANKSTD